MQVNKYSKDRRMVFSTIWIFYLFNILYADILTIMGRKAPFVKAAELIETLISPEMLLGTALFLETAMIMIIFSHVLKYGINRWLNITVALLHTLGLVVSLFVGTPTIFYIFFAVVEILALLFIVWYAWSWSEPQNE